MTSGEVRGKTLAELRRARKNMMSAEWLAGVEDLPEADRTAAATALLDVCLAIRRLENAASQPSGGNSQTTKRSLNGVSAVLSGQGRDFTGSRRT